MKTGEHKELSDEALVALYLENFDDRYFNMLYRRYASKVYGKCLTMLRNNADAEDAMQDIFTKLLLKLSAFKGKSRFSTWVFSITYNYCIDLLRKRGKRIFFDTDDIEQFDTSSESEVEDKYLLEVEVGKLKQVLNELPLGDKSVLLMKYQDELSIKEIGNIISKSESAVKMKIKRAKEKFRSVYKEKY